MDDLAAGHPAAHFGRVHVKDRHEFVTLADEVLMGQQGGAQVADAQQGHLPGLIQTQDALNFEEQFPDKITHAPDAKFTEVSQVFTDLGWIDAAFLG